MKLPKIRSILKKFKDVCRLQGWKTSQKNDWIRTEDGYHNFLWTRSIHPSSFRSITANRRCVIRKGLSYDVVEASYTAWLFSEAPPRVLVETVCENPDFSKRTALYNLSPILEDKNLGFKLNSTDSPVFQEFENFLQKELKVNLKSLLDPETTPKEQAAIKLV